MKLATSARTRNDIHPSKDRPEQFICFPASTQPALLVTTFPLDLVTRSYHAICSVTFLPNKLTQRTMAPSFMNVLEVALQFIFSRKAVVAAVLAPDHRTSILGSVGAMLRGIVTLKVAPLGDCSVAILFETNVFAGFEVMRSLVISKEVSSRIW